MESVRSSILYGKNMWLSLPRRMGNVSILFNYLITRKSYPKELLANEVLVKLNGTSKRCDTVAYNRFLEPLVIVEYKAPHINITNTVFDQIARYNMVLHVEYLIVSNGLNHYCCKIDYNNRTYTFLEEIPAYNEL